MLLLRAISAYKNKPHLWLSQFLYMVLVLVNLFSPSVYSAEQHWQSTDYIIDSFVDIALNNEYSAQASTLRKWTTPIHYQIIHRTADQTLHEKLTQTHLTHLAQITGLLITPATENMTPNLKIIFSSELSLQYELHHDFLLNNQQQVEMLARNGVCLGNFSIDANNAITQAIVIIPVDRARAHAKLLSCIVEELTQILGLPNDSDNVFPSIFNDKSTDDYLSGLDFILLKALYHPELHSGMNSQQVAKILKQLLNSNEFKQLIIHADQTAKQTGLYPLLNY